MTVLLANQSPSWAIGDTKMKVREARFGDYQKDLKRIDAKSRQGSVLRKTPCRLPHRGVGYESDNQ
jgi:hypothetical protein